MKKNSSVLLSNYILDRALDIQDVEKEEYFLSNVFYLSILLEKIVLHEHIIVRDFNSRDSDSKFYFEDRVKNDEILNYLSFNTYAFGIERPFDIEYAFDLMTTSFIFGEYFENSDRLPVIELQQIGYSVERNIPFIPDLSSQMRIALDVVDGINYEYTSQLYKRYDRIQNNFKSDILKLLVNGNNKPIFLPPITTIIFERARNTKEIFKVAFDLRNEFKEIRDVFSKYQSKIIDDSLSLNESLEALNILESDVNLIYPRNRYSIATKVKEWRGLTDLIRFLDGTSFTDISVITKLFLGKPMETIINKIKNRNVNYFVEFENDLQQVKNYGRLIQKLFKKDIRKNHIKIAIEEGFGNNILKKII